MQPATRAGSANDPPSSALRASRSRSASTALELLVDFLHRADGELGEDRRDDLVPVVGLRESPLGLTRLPSCSAAATAWVFSASDGPWPGVPLGGLDGSDAARP